MTRQTLVNRRLLLTGGCAFLSSLVDLRRATAGDAPAAPKPSEKPREARMVDWDELLPLKERRQAEDPKALMHDYLNEEGPSMKQTGSFATNAKLHGAFVKVPGFVVPITLSREGIVGEFLLVPYYGACVHLPPPPPNQIVYVKLQKPVRITTVWEPYWVTGVMTTARKETRMASSAYTLSGEKLERYEY